jgi:hypothetical protein
VVLPVTGAPLVIGAPLTGMPLVMGTPLVPLVQQEFDLHPTTADSRIAPCSHQKRLAFFITEFLSV